MSRSNAMRLEGIDLDLGGLDAHPRAGAARDGEGVEGVLGDLGGDRDGAVEGHAGAWAFVVDCGDRCRPGVAGRAGGLVAVERGGFWPDGDEDSSGEVVVVHDDEGCADVEGHGVTGEGASVEI